MDDYSKHYFHIPEYEILEPLFFHLPKTNRNRSKPKISRKITFKDDQDPLNLSLFANIQEMNQHSISFKMNKDNNNNLLKQINNMQLNNSISNKPSQTPTSSLSLEQHKMWWKLQNVPDNLLSHADNKLLKDAHKEQELYNRYIKDDLITRFKSNFMTYNKSIEQVIEPMLKEIKNDFIKYYKPYFSPMLGGSLDLENISDLSLNFAFCNQLLTIGSSFEIGDLHRRQSIPLNKSYWIPRDTKLQNQIDFLKKIQPPVSQDSYIYDLLKNNNVNIVISSSTLQILSALSVNERYDTWDIPIVIKNINNSKIIFVDKAYKRTMNLRDKNQKFFKMAIKNLCFKDKKPLKYMSPSDMEFGPNGGLYPDLISGNDNFMYNLWKLGNFKVLVRCRIDGLLPKNEHGIRPQAAMKTKVQYIDVPEEITNTEISKIWMKLHILGDSRLALSRVSIATNEIIEWKIMSMNDLLKHSREFKPEVAVSTIYSIFSSLNNLVEGEYLLSHQGGKSRVFISETTSDPNDISIIGFHKIVEKKYDIPTELPYIRPQWDFSNTTQIPYSFNPYNHKSNKKKRKRKMKT